MQAINKEIFTFDSDGLSGETFYVAEFEGTEALNTLFHFEIVLLCAKANIDTEALTGTNATFTIHREKGEDAVFKGYISKIRQSGRFNGYSYYTVHLSPLFEKYTHIVKSMIFLDNDLKETIEKVIVQEPFFKLDYEFRFADSYPKKEFAMQYNEKAFDYILWRLEEQGAYFYFDKGGERVIFTDNTRLHDSSQGTVYYSPSTGLELSVLGEVIDSFSLNEGMLPTKVVVRNYDWMNPNKIHVGMAEVCKGGFGDVYLTNEKTDSEEEANRIAKIRAEQLLAGNRVFKGSSSVPFLRPGVVFTLTKHFSDSFNRDYVVTKIKHEGRQESLLSFVLGLPVAAEQAHLFYRNTFECIEAGIKYRSSKTVARARIPGSIHAFIDGDKGGEPVLDKYGRYKVWFPFDVSGRSDGKASCWIRRAQEQIGKDSGFSFPLIPGTEVLITFLNGDPDQPVIDRALPNGETGSISGGGNKNLSGFRTSGGAQITFDNKHNLLQLANATGSEITFGTDSLDYFTDSTHNKLMTAAVGSSEVSGAIADNMSGYISRRRAVCSNPMWYIAGMVIAAGKTGQYVYDSLSGKASDPNEPKSDFAAQLTKLVPLIAFPKAPPYNIRLSADQKNASSRLQCFPSATELVINMTIMLLSRGASLATDIVDGKKVANACEEEKTEGSTVDVGAVKKNVIRNKIVGQAAGFLPELGAFIAVCMMAGGLRTKYLDRENNAVKSRTKNIGGIMIDAKDKNINLHAKTYIGSHAERGIYLNTKEARYAQDGYDDKIGEWGSPWVSEPRDVENDLLSVFKDIKDNFKERKDDDNLDSDIYFNVIANIKDGHVNTRAENSWGAGVGDIDNTKGFVSDSKSNTRKEREETNNRGRKSFIAGNTDLHLIQSQSLFQETFKSWVSISPHFFIFQGPRRQEKDSNMNDPEDNFVRPVLNYPSAIVMRERRVYFYAHGMIRLIGPKLNLHGAIGRQQFIMTNDAIFHGVEVGEDNFHGAIVTNKMVFLHHCTKEQQPALVALLDGEIHMSAFEKEKIAYVILNSREVKIHAKTVEVAGLCLEDGIDGTENGMLNIGDTMKAKIKTFKERYPKPIIKDRPPE